MIGNKQKSIHYQNIKEKTKRANVIKIKNDKLILHIIISFCLPVLQYIQTINFGFTNFDDDGIITNHFAFLNDFRNIPRAFLSDAFVGKSNSFYRPLQTLSYMIDVHISGGGQNPWMLHLSNILILSSISILILFLLRQFLVPAGLALLSTLIYCSHPLFVFFVIWIPARGDLLLTFFALFSFLFLLKFIQNRKIVYLILNWTLFTFALFSKETALVLPFLFIFYYLLFNSEKRLEKKYYFIIFLYVISCFFWFLLRFMATGIISDQKNDTFGLSSFLSNLRTIPESLANFFFPFDLNPIPVFSIYKTLAGLVILLIIIIIIIQNTKRSKRAIIFCFSWFLLLMLPPMFYKDHYFDYLNHRFFLPLTGIFFFLLFILPVKWMQKGNVKNPWILILILVFFCIFTLIKSRSYSDPMSFYNLAISENPYSSMAYANRGIIKSGKDDFQDALEDYNEAIKLDPGSGENYYNKALANSRLGNYQEALEDYRKTIALIPDYEFAYNNRGYLKSTINDIEGALADYNKAIDISPDYDMAYLNRGLLKLNKLGDRQGAINDFKHVISIKHKYDDGFYRRVSDAWYNIGFSDMRSGNYKQAIESYNKSIEFCPDCFKSWSIRGSVKLNTGDYTGALNDFNKALEINPNYPDNYYNRALVKYKLNDLNGALDDCETMLKAIPYDEKSIKLKIKTQQELQNISH